MKKIIKGLCVIYSMLFVMTACHSVKTTSSDDVEQRLIFQQYFVKYDANEELLTATAKFALNNNSGEQLRLSRKSSVDFNGEDLEAMEAGDAFFYQWEDNVDFPKEFVFTYQNDDKRNFTNAVVLSKFELKDKKCQLSKAGLNELAFSGKAFTDSETLECVILQEGAFDDKSACSIFPVILDASTIRINGEDLTLAAGEYEMYFIRRNSSTDIKAMDRGGLWESEYDSKKISVEIR